MKQTRKEEFPFTEVRQNLAAILDDVEKSGKPITILRHGKPAAVIVSHHAYEEQVARTKPPFRLAGSLKIASGVDIDDVLARAKKERIALLDKPMKRSK